MTNPDYRGHAGQAVIRQKDTTTVARGGVGWENGPPLLTGWALGPEISTSLFGTVTVTLSNPAYRAVNKANKPRQQANTQNLVAGRSPSTKLARAPKL